MSLPEQANVQSVKVFTSAVLYIFIIPIWTEEKETVCACVVSLDEDYFLFSIALLIPEHVTCSMLLQPLLNSAKVIPHKVLHSVKICPHTLVSWVLRF